MTLPTLPAAFGLAAVLAAAPAALAHDGHDDGPAAPAATTLPRFAAVSEAFELVGIVHGRRIALYLDRAGDNSPVAEARIELEIGGAKLEAARRGGDEFEVMLAAEPGPGVLPVTATVIVGAESDLLAGELDIHEAAPEPAPYARSWKAYAAWGGGGLAALALLVALARRKAGFGGAA